MSTLITWGRILLASLALAAFTPYISAQTGRSTTQTQTSTPARTRTTEATAEQPRAGDPDLGMVIIVGCIGFFVLVAWIFSRTGDDGSRGPDRTLL